MDVRRTSYLLWESIWPQLSINWLVKSTDIRLAEIRVWVQFKRRNTTLPLPPPTPWYQISNTILAIIIHFIISLNISMHVFITAVFAIWIWWSWIQNILSCSSIRFCSVLVPNFKHYIGILAIIIHFIISIIISMHVSMSKQQESKQDAGLRWTAWGKHQKFSFNELHVVYGT